MFKKICLGVGEYLPHAGVPEDTQATKYLHSPRNAIYSAHSVGHENKCWDKTAQPRNYRVMRAIVATKTQS